MEKLKAVIYNMVYQWMLLIDVSIQGIETQVSLDDSLCENQQFNKYRKFLKYFPL